MPLLILTGSAAVGKTTIANRLVDAFKERGIEPILVTDATINSQFNRSADFYLDKRKNVDHINSLKSEVLRIIGKNSNDFVIVDSMNYARSQRYELFVTAKNNRTTFAIVFCDADNDTSDWLNEQRQEKYESNVITDLRCRFERPKPHLKGDKPVFELTICRPNDLNGDSKTPQNIILPIDDLYYLLVEGKTLEANKTAVPTQKPSSTFMTEVDNTTQKIVKHIIENQHNAGFGGIITLPWNTDVKFTVKQFHTLVGLNRSRGRFMDMARQGMLPADSDVDHRFVEYLNAV